MKDYGEDWVFFQGFFFLCVKLTSLTITGELFTKWTTQVYTDHATCL